MKLSEWLFNQCAQLHGDPYFYDSRMVPPDVLRELNALRDEYAVNMVGTACRASTLKPDRVFKNESTVHLIFDALDDGNDIVSTLRTHLPSVCNIDWDELPSGGIGVAVVMK